MLRGLLVGDTVAVCSRERTRYGFVGVIVSSEGGSGEDPYQFFRVHFDWGQDEVFDASELQLIC